MDNRRGVKMTGEEFLKNSTLGPSATEDKCDVCYRDIPKEEQRLWILTTFIIGGDITYGNYQVCNSLGCMTVMAQTQCECSKCSGGPTTVHV